MKRKAIRKDEYLAAALACLLPQDKRDELRRARVPAKEVLRLFSPDHIWLHSLGGPDVWWNLDPRLRPAHAEKSRRDTAISAKVKRLLAGPRKPRKKIAARKNPWPPAGCRPFATRKPNVRDISDLG